MKMLPRKPAPEWRSPPAGPPSPASAQGQPMPPDSYVEEGNSCVRTSLVLAIQRQEIPPGGVTAHQCTGSRAAHPRASLKA